MKKNIDYHEPIPLIFHIMAMLKKIIEHDLFVAMLDFSNKNIVYSINIYNNNISRHGNTTENTAKEDFIHITHF